jgi:hypothetical protein
MDQGRRVGLGRGRGTAWTWSENQGLLFLQLLAHRQAGYGRAPLCNIPVWLWLVRGDDFVPLRQARRALGTWAGPVRHGAKHTAAAAARDTLDRWGQPRSSRSDRARFIAEMTKIGAGYPFDREAALRAVRAVIDPAGEGHPPPPSGMGMTADGIVTIMEARSEALRRLDELSDEVLGFARLRFELFAHMSPFPGPEADATEAQPLIGAESPYGVCMQLVTILGLILLTQRYPEHTAIFDFRGHMPG